MPHFLLIYDAKRQMLLDKKEYDRPGTALSAYQDAEDLHRRDPDVQVVLVAADSIETVEATHGNLFRVLSVQDLIRIALA